ncbi:MAG: DUF4301 family protein, partial [Candidatus Eisenbacteria bacterium]|nr:DUF4301 family protein [Candidatus Eisenbacteria bacterium]
MTHQWTPEDQAQIAARGMTVRDVEEHLDRFARGFPAIVLDRPCTVEDGIRTITHAETLGLEARFREARLSGRVSKFVPASGAASRMFHSLLVALHESWSLEDTTLAAHRDDGRDEDREFVRRFFAEAHALPFAPDLGLNAGDTPAADERLRLLRALLLEEGLGFADLPKGLIPFHRYGDEVRTAFEEHLVESLAYVRAGDGSIRLHFTVPDPQRERIASHLQACADRLGARFEISLSVQDPATDTIAVDATNEPARDANGRLLFRPGGHGA